MAKKSDYFQKFKDPRWQKKRLKILERDDWSCKVCSSTDKTLNVHHIFYVNDHDPWEYPDCILTSLCESCHKQIHDIDLLRYIAYIALSGKIDCAWAHSDIGMLINTIYSAYGMGEINLSELLKSEAE